MPNFSYPELDAMSADMAVQSELYRPTAFWSEASNRIADEFRAEGVHRFRSLLSPSWFFVPTYGVPGGGFTAEQVNALRTWWQQTYPEAKKPAMSIGQLLDGYSQALSDYRVLLASDQSGAPLCLNQFSESSSGEPLEQFEFEGRKFSRSSLNYLLGLAFLKKHLAGEQIRTVIEIGGGFGTLGEILASCGQTGLRYVDIDIPPTAFAAQYYLQTALGAENVATYAQTKNQSEIEIADLPATSVLCSWQIEKLRGQADLFVNFISFQEMEPHIVKNYLSHISRLKTKWVLLRNLREGKQRRQEGHWVGVDTPIVGDDYTQMLPNYDVIARNVLPFGYRTVDGFHSELTLLRRK